MRVLRARKLMYSWLMLASAAALGLAACGPGPGGAMQAGPAAPPTGHFAGTVQAVGQPTLHAALELRHPRPGHYEAELVVTEAPSLSFVGDSLVFQKDTLRLARPGRPGEALVLGRQGDFWRGTLVLDSVRYPVLLVRRGEPTPATYRVRPDEVAGSSGPALLFSPADESLAGLALALFPATATAAEAPVWADALARQGHTVLLLPAADTLTAPALANALALLRRTAGVDTARVGAWLSGRRAAYLPQLLAENTASRPAFVVVQDAPAPPLPTRPGWRALARRGAVLALYAPTQAGAGAQMRALLGGQRVRLGPAATLRPVVSEWLRNR